MAGEVVVSVLRASKGRVLRKGDVLGVLYSGSLENGGGQRFDANYDFNTFAVIPGRQLFTFTLGSGQVIEGWDQALSGRRLGEVLDLVIPSGLAYGSAGAPPSIPPDAPLRFRVELVGPSPTNKTKAVYPAYTELGLSKKLANELEAIKVKLASRKLGTDADDILTGGSAKDLLIGLAGSDLIQGGLGADVLIGGPGSNRFLYADLADSPARRGGQDRILGFQSSSDQIDLSSFGDALTFVAQSKFGGSAGEVRFSKGLLQLDLDGNGRADLEVLLNGVSRFSDNNLLL